VDTSHEIGQRPHRLRLIDTHWYNRDALADRVLDFAPNLPAGLNTMDDLINSCAAGGCYLNWHTTVSPGGAVRVNLCPASRGANIINAVAVNDLVIEAR